MPPFRSPSAAAAACLDRRGQRRLHVVRVPAGVARQPAAPAVGRTGDQPHAGPSRQRRVERPLQARLAVLLVAPSQRPPLRQVGRALGRPDEPRDQCERRAGGIAAGVARADGERLAVLGEDRAAALGHLVEPLQRLAIGQPGEGHERLPRHQVLAVDLRQRHGQRPRDIAEQLADSHHRHRRGAGADVHRPGDPHAPQTRCGGRPRVCVVERRARVLAPCARRQLAVHGVQIAAGPGLGEAACNRARVGRLVAHRIDGQDRAGADGRDGQCEHHEHEQPAPTPTLPPTCRDHSCILPQTRRPQARFSRTRPRGRSIERTRTRTSSPRRRRAPVVNPAR